MSIEFWQTRLGQKLCEATLPNAVREIGRLADTVAALNQTLTHRIAPCTSAPAQTSDQSCRLRVLIADDDKRFLRGCKRLLEHSHDVQVAASVEQALQMLTEHELDVVIADCDMPDKGSGVVLLGQVRARWPQVRRILTSGRPAAELEEHVSSGLAHCHLPKPFRAEDLLASLLSEDL